MKSDCYIIRKKRLEDSVGIQKLITLSWQQTYKGIISDEYLNSLNLNEKERIKKSLNAFDEKNNNELVLEINNKIVGFVKYGKCKDSNFSGYGEINALYLLNDYQGNGYGKLLFESAMQQLQNQGYFKIIVGCLEGNKSNAFYKHLGGKFKSTRMFSRGGQDFIENIYIFNNFSN